MALRSILGVFDPATAEEIYQDNVLGMDTPSKLFYWVKAFEGQKGSYIYSLIQDYFLLQGVNMTDGNMTALMGPQSMIGQIYNAQKSLAYKLFQNDSSNVLDQDLLWQTQWGNQSIMTDKRIYLAPTIPPVVWFREVDPVNIIGNLEYSYYVNTTFKKSVPVIGVSDV